FCMRAGDDGVWIRELAFDATGSADESIDVGEVHLYADSDNSGALGKVVWSPAIDEEIATAQSFGGDDGRIIFTLDDAYYIEPNVTQRFFVVYDLTGSIELGETLGLELESVSAIGGNGAINLNIPSGTVGTGNNGGAPMPLPSVSANLIARAGTANPPDRDVVKDAAGIYMLHFTLESNLKNNAVLKSLTFTLELRNGAAAADIKSGGVKLYVDHDYDGDGDLLLGASSVAGSEVKFNNIMRSIPSGGIAGFLVTMDLKGTADKGKTFKMKLARKEDVAFTTQHCNVKDLPLAGGQLGINHSVVAQINLPGGDTVSESDGDQVLDGSDSYDPDTRDEITEYSWSIVNTPFLGVGLQNSHAAQATLQLADSWLPYKVDLELRVTGRDGTTDTETKTITVLSDEELYSDPDCLEDLNGDGIVDLLDLQILSSYWLYMGECPADLNGDLIVNFIDYAMLAAKFQKVSPSGRALPLNNAPLADNAFWESFDFGGNSMSPNSLTNGGPHFGYGDATPDLSSSALYQDTLGHVPLHSGEFIYRKVISSVAGTDVDFNFVIMYSTRAVEMGQSSVLGSGWSSNLFATCTKIDGNTLQVDTGLHKKINLIRDGATEFFDGQAGCYSTIYNDIGNNQYVMRDRYGDTTYFEKTSPTSARIVKTQTPCGSHQTMTYTGSTLTGITDSHGRTYTFGYSEGKLSTLTENDALFPDGGPAPDLAHSEDPEGLAPRVHLFSVVNNFLVSYTTPEVHGTSTGNDYPDGTTTMYLYHSGNGDYRVDNKMSDIIGPNEVADGSMNPYLQIDYYNLTNDFPICGRVETITTGGTNYAGTVPFASVNYVYTPLEPGFQVDVNDRESNLAQYIINDAGLISSVTRQDEFGVLNITNSLTFNSNNEITSVVYNGYTNPNVVLSYDDDGPMHSNKGNLEVITRYNDPDGALPIMMAGPFTQDEIQWGYTYDIVFNQVVGITEPRGMDSSYVPDNGGTWSRERYTTVNYLDYQELENPNEGIAGAVFINRYGDLRTLLTNVAMDFDLGDINGDGLTEYSRGWTIGTCYPDVELIDHPGVADQSDREGDTTQKAGVSIAYNDVGKVISRVDEEQNITLYLYYTTQNFEGGERTEDGVYYLAEQIRDTDYPGWLTDRSAAIFGDETVGLAGRESGLNPALTEITLGYEYNITGAITADIDGRGVRTEYELGAFNVVLRETRAADVSAAAGRGGGINNLDETGLTVFNYDKLFFYGPRLTVLGEFVENDNADTLDGDNRDPIYQQLDLFFPDGTGWIETYNYYYMPQWLYKTRQELNTTEVATTLFDYGYMFRPTKTTYPEADVKTFNTYNFRNLLKTTTRGYESDKPSTVTYEYDWFKNKTKMIDAVDNDAHLGGDPNPEETIYIYDGYGRLVETIQPDGTQVKLGYDPASNIKQREIWGVVDGTVKPVDNITANNVLLEKTIYYFDERGRQYCDSENLFLAAGTTLNRAFTPDGTEVNTWVDFDRKGRTTFIIEHDNDVNENQYDGASRVIKQYDSG
ncbi:dockerin type I domain-containing protein, partial [Planctomycetota bacterium]